MRDVTSGIHGLQLPKPYWKDAAKPVGVVARADLVSWAGSLTSTEHQRLLRAPEPQCCFGELPHTLCNRPLHPPPHSTERDLQGHLRQFVGLICGRLGIIPGAWGLGLSSNHQEATSLAISQQCKHQDKVRRMLTSCVVARLGKKDSTSSWCLHSGRVPTVLQRPAARVPARKPALRVFWSAAPARAPTEASSGP